MKRTGQLPLNSCLVINTFLWGAWRRLRLRFVIIDHCAGLHRVANSRQQAVRGGIYTLVLKLYDARHRVSRLARNSITGSIVSEVGRASAKHGVSDAQLTLATVIQLGLVCWGSQEPKTTAAAYRILTEWDAHRSFANRCLLPLLV